ncbi:MAG: ATP-dependent DNA helicase RecG, partial [Crocinitomicaceae bacterium]
YPSTEKLSAKGLHSRGIEKLVNTRLPQIVGKIEDALPSWIAQQHRLVGKEEALVKTHQPTNLQEVERARFRLKFEEMFFLQLELLIRKGKNEKETKGHVFETTGDYFNEFYSRYLPFELTNAQKRVIKEIRKDLGSGKHMNRLVQGDVGSGKTLVALLCMLIANGNGFQAALMAPTEILATQHFENIKELLGQMSIGIRLLTGSTKKAERKIIHEELDNGTCKLLIGTHALLEDPVQFQNLGLVVIDEQHRFGVAQRAKMRAKNALAPHILIMTATPIPRTLAMTFYGDLDVSVIDELPPGRKPISTIHRYESHRLALLGFMKKEIDKGRQVYVVYPLIKESERMDFHNLMDGFEAISRYFPMPQYQVSIVHGKLKPEVKEYEMQRFVKGETHIMVATTVIEVGVNVPNASVMVIESAERFGLSQLHQLRGRVGRGAEKSYCILMTGDAISKESKKRMDTMVETQDGFEISEVDLQLRGPGDLMGTQQSGALQFKIANLAKDGQIIQLARNTVQELISKDFTLEIAEHQKMKRVLQQLLASKPNWGKIA